MLEESSLHPNLVHAQDDQVQGMVQGRAAHVVVAATRAHDILPFFFCAKCSQLGFLLLNTPLSLFPGHIPAVVCM